MLNRLQSHLSGRVRHIAKSTFGRMYGQQSASVNDNLIKLLFDNQHSFNEYSREFDDSVADIQSERMDEFYEIVPEKKAAFGGMNVDHVRTLYAIIRVLKPDVVVETGVCNGVSTLVVLMALEKNDNGSLYSIDFPTYSDKPAPEFQLNQYPEDHTFSAIPNDKNPGWIVPDRLRHRWELRTGKSQRKLPSLLEELEDIDVFIHDSDHTFPCMMFEYELAWEYLRSGGVLLSDDIHSNNAFEVFGDKRADKYGEAILNLGYALK